MTMNEQDQQLTQITKLIRLGTDQGYITYPQMSDILTNVVDTEQFDVITTMIEKMNIKVYEHPPRGDELALLGNTEDVPEDLDEAAAFLASVDKETGRTSDPVRLYMREMGTVELLTREGEIRIAKRIEEGIYQVLRSLAHYPETVKIILDDYRLVLQQEMRLNEIISGFSDDEGDAAPANIGSMLDDVHSDVAVDASILEDTDDVDADSAIVDVDDGPHIEQAAAYFEELEQTFEQATLAVKTHGRANALTQEKLELMSESFLRLKLTSREVDKLTRHFRQLSNHIRELERNIMRL